MKENNVTKLVQPVEFEDPLSENVRNKQTAFRDAVYELRGHVPPSICIETHSPIRIQRFQKSLTRGVRLKR